jgi:hypothetical protein
MTSEPEPSLDPADPEFQAAWAAATSDTGWAVVDYDPDIWLDMPVVCDPDSTFPDHQSWARGAAQAVWSGQHVDPYEIDSTALTLTKFAEEFAGFKMRAHQIFLHLPTPRMMPLPVGLGIWKTYGDRAEHVRHMVGADDPNVAEPPVVEDFATEQLGSGLRCLRYIRNSLDPANLIVALNYAWRVDDLDTDYRLFASTADLGRLVGYIGDIDNLARAIQPVPSGQ